MCGTGRPGRATSRSTRPGITPRQAASSSALASYSSCMPRQMPSTGCVSVRQERRKTLALRRRCIASPAAPTPGRITRGALRSFERVAGEPGGRPRGARARNAATRCSRRRCRRWPRTSMRPYSRALAARQFRALDPHRLAQRAAHTLEAGLDHVMRVLALDADVHRRAQAVGQRPEEVRHELGRQTADRLAVEATLEHRDTAGPRDRSPPARGPRPWAAGTRSARCRACRRAPARRAWPSASAQSSTVWCSSTSRSPVHVKLERETRRDARPARACGRRTRCRWRYATGAVRSRSTATSIAVSRVRRATRAVRSRADQLPCDRVPGLSPRRRCDGRAAPARRGSRASSQVRVAIADHVAARRDRSARRAR